MEEKDLNTFFEEFYDFFVSASGNSAIVARDLIQLLLRDHTSITRGFAPREFWEVCFAGLPLPGIRLYVSSKLMISADPEYLDSLNPLERRGLFLHLLLLGADLAVWQPKPEAPVHEWGLAWAVAKDILIAESIRQSAEGGLDVAHPSAECSLHNLRRQGFRGEPTFEEIFGFLRQEYASDGRELVHVFRPPILHVWLNGPVFLDEELGYHDRLNLRGSYSSNWCLTLLGKEPFESWLKPLELPMNMPWRLRVKNSLAKIKKRLTHTQLTWRRTRSSAFLPVYRETPIPLLVAIENSATVRRHPRLEELFTLLTRTLYPHPLLVLLYDSQVRLRINTTRLKSELLCSQPEAGDEPIDPQKLFRYLRCLPEIGLKPDHYWVLVISGQPSMENVDTCPFKPNKIFPITLF